jgi:uncharacterized membrane protein YeaQ/YmgE (transglycosylase-associated protein family)
MNIFILIALGLAVGWLASRFLATHPTGLLGDLVAGGVGASVAGVLAGRLLPGGAGLGLFGIVVAVLGASLVIAGTRLMTGGSRLASQLTFWKADRVGPLSEPVRLRLAAERGLGAQDAAPLRMRQEHGRYADRTVTYFQVFDPATAGTPGADLRHLRTLDARHILYSGFIERNGQIVLNDNRSERNGLHSGHVERDSRGAPRERASQP